MWFLECSGTELNSFSGPNPDRCRVTRTCSSHYSEASSVDPVNPTAQHALKYTLKCTRCQTPSLHDHMVTSILSRCFQSHSRARTQVHSQLHWMSCSQPASLSAPKVAHRTLSIALPSMHSSTLTVALKGSLPAFLPTPFKRYLQDTPKNTSEYDHYFTSESLRSKLSRVKTLPHHIWQYAPMCGPGYWIQ